MKKLILSLAILGGVAVTGFVILLAQTTPDKAPSGPVVVDITNQLGD